MSDITVRTTMQPDEAERESVLEALRRFTRDAVPQLDNQDFAALVADASGQVVGGLIASSRWNGFHVEMIALPDTLRGKGIGTKLLNLAEQEARRHNCNHMFLDTYAFQAKPFYERHGFEVFGEIEGPPPYYPRFFLKKNLS